MEKVVKGVTMRGYVFGIGLVLCTFSIACFFGPIYLIIAGFPLLFFGIICFLAIEGTLIDIDKKQAKVYYDLLFFKVGKWKDITNYKKILLRYENSTQTMNYQSLSSTITTRSFDIYFKSENEPDIYVQEFTRYSEAKAFLDKFSKLLGMEVYDQYKELYERIQERRRERERERENY
ncbi:MAG: hypothetical protein V2A54_09580 [Bacteroidota bacterium]